MCSLSCCDLTYEDYEQDGLRARAEQALGELAQALIDNPTLHDAVTAALGAREKALEAQQAAMSALNLPSATDVERLERRLRSFSQRLEDVEEAIDDLSRELGALRRENAAKKSAEEKPKPNPQPRGLEYGRGGAAGPFRRRLQLLVAELAAVARLGDDEHRRDRDPSSAAAASSAAVCMSATLGQGRRRGRARAGRGCRG